jgi:hypothetical protein
VSRRKAKGPPDANRATPERRLGKRPARNSLSPADQSTRDDDPRRLKPAEVKLYLGGKVGQLKIDGVLWAAVEWSEKRQAWCIEDAEGRCLEHASHIRGQEASKEAALALAQEMIRDGRMPTPEAAEQQRKDRLERRRNTPSAKRRREQRQQEDKQWSEAISAEYQARDIDEDQLPLHEAIAEAFDLSDPELWRSNAFASLRPRLIIHVKRFIAKLASSIAYSNRRASRRRWKTGPKKEEVDRLARAREILQLLDPDGSFVDPPTAAEKWFAEHPEEP